MSSESSRAGSWSFEFRDNKIRELGLNLFQSGDKIFGTGTMNDGNITLEISASGSVKGDRMNLDLTSSETISLYKLELTTSGDSASGDYEAFSSEGESWTGRAKGARNMSSK